MSLKTLTYYFKTSWNIPALIFHELCHVIFCIILGIHIIKVDWWFFGEETDKDGNTFLKGCGVDIDCEDDSPWKVALASIAPLIGLYMLMWIASCIGGAIFLIIFSYIMISFKVFVPSQKDIETFMDSI